MAEAFPEEPTTSEIHEEVNRNNSVLFLASRWQFDTYGLSTVNKSLVNNLRFVDPEAKSIKITCTVVEEEENLSTADLEDAEKVAVRLKGAKLPRGKKGHHRPDLQWLDENTGTYYYHVISNQSYDFIIGHAPYLANGCFNLKDIYQERGIHPKIILMIHGLPKDTNGDTDDNMLFDWLNEADIVFSVGKAVENELIPYIETIDKENRPIHKMYIPSFPLELFSIVRVQKGKNIEGTQFITMMSAEYKDLDVTGLDFPLAVNATIGAAEHIRDFDGVRTNLTMLVANDSDREKWKSAGDELLKKQNVPHTGLSFKAEVPADFAKLQFYLKRSTLFLLPLKPDSPLFGTEALSAIAAGVPVLVSRYSGVASFLHKILGDESVVYKMKPATDTWRDKIVERLLKPEDAQQEAERLRKQFLFDVSIAETHLDFINIIAKKACIELEVGMECHADAAIPQKHLDEALKFGLEKINASDVKKYAEAFLRQLFLQSPKIDKQVLENHLNPKIINHWQELLSSLEDKNRKLINTQSGSLVFTLFCPTQGSRRQLQDENWRVEIQRKMTVLLKVFGAEMTVKLDVREFIGKQHLQNPLKAHHLMRSQKAKITDSDTCSLGYETMTTVSELDPEVLESGFKVEGWLSQHQESGIAALGEKYQSIELVKTWTLDHVNADPEYVKCVNRFTISESGAIGISCEETPSLSVMYPDTNKAPVILSDDTVYWSATFVKANGKEYLAAACDEDGCLYLWDIETQTSKKVFDPELYKDKVDKHMVICKIDESTIGYAEVSSSLDDSRKIFILKMDTAKYWTLTATLKLFTTGLICDICYTEMSDGTPCLLLCLPRSKIMAVELDSSTTRWEVGKDQIGEKFNLWSICTDEDNDIIYVADYDQEKIHLVSTSDGSVIKRFNIGGHYNMRYIFTVRFHDQHLYVEHKIQRQNEYKYAVTKFKQKIEK